MRQFLAFILCLWMAFFALGCAIPTGTRSASVDLSKKSATYTSDTRTPEQIKADVATALSQPVVPAPEPAPATEPAPVVKP